MRLGIRAQNHDRLIPYLYTPARYFYNLLKITATNDLEKLRREIPLPWTTGNQTAILLVSWPVGGAGSIHVTISHRYEGQIVKASTGEWLFHPSSKTCPIQGDDIPLLIEAIESYLDSLGDIQRALLAPY